VESFRFVLLSKVDNKPLSQNVNSVLPSPAAAPFSAKTGVGSSLNQRFNFFPGQFVQVIFDRTNISNALFNKYLSFSSSPTKDYMEVTKKLSESQFSQKLKNLKIDDTVFLNGPLGNCVFRDNDDRLCFLVGGIGVTPAISIIEYVMEKKLGTDITLIYSNKTEGDIAFKRELDVWQAINKKVRVVYIVTEARPEDKSCLWGVLNKNLLIREVKDIDKRVFFIFGPPVMVTAMKNLCVEADCPGRSIRAENFIGY
jgi:ferredoxin-NADP reductase